MMDCPEGVSDMQNSSVELNNTQMFEDCDTPSAQEIKDITSPTKTTTQNEEGVSKENMIADGMTSFDSTSVKSSQSADVPLWTSVPLANDDSTPELFGTSLEETAKSSDIKTDSDINISASPKVNSKNLQSSQGGSVQLPAVKFSESLENNADPAIMSVQSSTPVNQPLPKSRIIGCQSTPSGPEGGHENAPQLSISTPDLFLRTSKNAPGTPLSRENTSMSDEDLLSSQKDERVSSSLDINDENSTDRLLSDDSFYREVQERKKNYGEDRIRAANETSSSHDDSCTPIMPETKKEALERVKSSDDDSCPQKALETLKSSDDDSCPQKALETLKSSDDDSSTQKALETLKSSDDSCPQKALETVRSSDDDSCPQKALETVRSSDDGSCPQKALETSHDSDDIFKVPQNKRQPEKRRKGDVTDDSGSDLPSHPKKPCLNGSDSRRSVTIVEEIRKSPPQMNSQDVLLHYSASQPEDELGVSSDSIVQLDEEVEIVEVSAEPKEAVLEITLDGSNRTPSPGKGQSSMETEPASPTDDSVGKTINVVKKIVITQRYAVECHLKADASNGKILNCNIVQFEPGETSFKEDLEEPPRSADSSGVLADESSPPSPPRHSLGSTVSGPGPFRLQPSALQRMSMFSTTSSSSTGSANNILPNKGLPPRATVGKANKSDLFGIPMAEWKPGCDIEEVLKASLTSFVQTELSTNLNSGSKRNSQSPCSLNKKFCSEDNADPSTKAYERKTSERLSSVEGSTSSEIKRARKNVTSPSTLSRRTPSQRTPSQRLQTRKTKENAETGQETPNSERRRRGRPSPAIKDTPCTGTPKTLSTVSAIVQSPHTPLTPGSSAFQPGMKVFAMWRDKKFYPAELVERVRDGRWRVLFLTDEQQKVLPERSVLLFSTFECDQDVLTLTPRDDFYKSGKITHVKSFENEDDLYTVTLDDSSTVEVTWRELSLSERQAQALLGGQVHQKPVSAKRLLVDYSLDNVVHGKRLRSMRCSSPTVPSSSKSFKISTPGNTTFEEVGEPECSLSITGIEPESANVNPLAGKGSKRGKGRKRSVAEKPRNPEEEKLLERLGPIPPPDSNLFAGLTFFITSTSLRLQHEHRSLNSDVSSGNLTDTDGYTDCECYVFSTLPMVKPRLLEQLTAGGGRVLKSVDQLEPEVDRKTVFVVSDRPCRTAVYIRCLALGIKSILHDWIVDCCKENKPLKLDELSYLPVGYSSCERRFIQWSEIKDREAFLDKGILVQSRNPSFVTFWEKVVRSAGGKVLSVADLELATVIVGENPLPEFSLLKAQAAGVPVVSANWVTQSLINGDAIALDDSPQLCLLFSESE